MDYQAQLKDLKGKLEADITNTLLSSLVNLDPAGTAQWNVSVDAGSTATRTQFYTTQKEYLTAPVVATPSTLGKYLPTKLSLKPEGNLLSDNLYLILEKLDNNFQATKTHHVMFGAMKNREHTSPVHLQAGLSKATSEATQLTTISGIAFHIIEQILNGKTNASAYKLHLNASLRPKDIRSDDAINMYKSGIIGTYRVTYPLVEKLSFTVTIEDDVFVIGEPTANGAFTSTFLRDKKYSTILLVDGGGSSLDNVLIEGKNINASKSDNEATGGEDIRKMFQASCESTLGFPLTEQQMRDIQITGKLVRNKKEYGCGSIAAAIAEHIANLTVSALYTQAQYSNKTIHAIDCVALNGRLYNSELPESQRPAKLIEQQLKRTNPDIDVHHLDDEFNVVRGLTIISGRK